MNSKKHYKDLFKNDPKLITYSISSLTTKESCQDLITREDCIGKLCRKYDWSNEGGNVAFCCKYHQGQRYPNGEYHCCNEEDACKDNYQEYDECPKEW